MIDSVDEEPAPLRLGFDAYQRTHCVPLADSPSGGPGSPGRHHRRHLRPGYPMVTACGSINGAVEQFQLARSVVMPDRLEVVMKSPVREAYPEVAGGDIGEAEMDAQPHSCVDDVCAQGTPAVVVAGDSGDGC